MEAPSPRGQKGRGEGVVCGCKAPGELRGLHGNWGPEPSHLYAPNQHHHGARSSSIHPPTIPLVAVPLAPITGFSLPALVLQLFGFVYACYVSKVFLEEEDSCECLCY